LFAGNVRAGATGIAGTVVKVSIIENVLVPPAFVAFTFQKYFVLGISAVFTVSFATVRVESLITSVANVVLVDT
jgi:hypothetical protein